MHSIHVCFNSLPKFNWKGVHGTISHISYLFPELNLNLINRVARETVNVRIEGSKQKR